MSAREVSRPCNNRLIPLIKVTAFLPMWVLFFCRYLAQFQPINPESIAMMIIFARRSVPTSANNFTTQLYPTPI